MGVLFDSIRIVGEGLARPPNSSNPRPHNLCVNLSKVQFIACVCGFIASIVCVILASHIDYLELPAGLWSLFLIAPALGIISAALAILVLSKDVERQYGRGWTICYFILSAIVILALVTLVIISGIAVGKAVALLFNESPPYYPKLGSLKSLPGRSGGGTSVGSYHSKLSSHAISISVFGIFVLSVSTLSGE